MSAFSSKGSGEGFEIECSGHRHDSHDERAVHLGHERFEHPGRFEPERLGGLPTE